MHEYKVAWLDTRGEKHETIVTATNITQAERAVWQDEEACLNVMRTIQID